MDLFTWKEEPVSPAGGQEYPEEWLLFEDEEAKFPLKAEAPPEPLEDVWLPESPSGSNTSTSLTISRAELASKLLIELEGSLLDEQDQSLDWFEQKTDLPIFDELPSPPTPSTSPIHECHMTFAPMVVAPMPPAPMPPAPMAYNIVMGPVHMQPKISMFGGATLSPPLALPMMNHDMAPLMAAQVVPQLAPQIVHQVEHTTDTASLLQEFENVYDETVMTLGALTPPQSPPGAPVLHELKVASPRPTMVPSEMILPHSNGLTELDEIVRARAEEAFLNGPPEPASPVTSVSSCAPSLDEPSLDQPSPSPSPSSESSDDPDWVPSPVAAPTAVVARGRGRKRASSTKPYARATQEDKKLRKKEQNKNAATRYRLKKKAEVEEILEEEQGLQDENDKLKVRVGELSQEIKYLKDLMRDVCRAKGLIK